MAHPHKLLFDSDWKLILAMKVKSLIELTSTPHWKVY